MSLSDEVKDRISNLSEEALLRMVEVDSKDYTGEAIEFAKGEINRRSLQMPSKASPSSGSINTPQRPTQDERSNQDGYAALIRFDKKECSSVVERLQAIVSAITFIIVIQFVLIGIVIGAVVFGGIASAASQNNMQVVIITGIIGVVLGGAVGAYIGKIVASFFTVTMEWMMQMLITNVENIRILNGLSKLV